MKGQATADPVRAYVLRLAADMGTPEKASGTLEGGWVYGCDGHMVVALQRECLDLPPAGEGAPTKFIRDLLVLPVEGTQADLAALRDWVGIPSKPCSECHGRGVAACEDCDGEGRGTHTCDKCDKTHKGECEECGGTGEAECYCAPLRRNPGRILGDTFDRAKIHEGLRYAPTAGIVYVCLSNVGLKGDPGLLLAGDGFRVYLMPFRGDPDAKVPTFKLSAPASVPA